MIGSALTLCLALALGGPARAAELETALFAGGCFWCMEPPFEKLAGVVSAESGYTGGRKEAPTYEEVSSGETGHAEAVRVVFDPKKVSYAELLDVFWANVDPTRDDGQFCDAGRQYRPGIFYRGDEQKAAAEASVARARARLKAAGPIVVELSPAGRFYPAEAYHQDYYKKNPLRYKFYRTGCGRDKRLRELWGQAGP